MTANKEFRHFFRSLSLLAAAMSVWCPLSIFSQATPKKITGPGQVIAVPEVVTQAPEAHPTPPAPIDPRAESTPLRPASSPEIRRALPLPPAIRSEAETNSPATVHKPMTLPGTITTTVAEPAHSNSLNSVIAAIVNSMPRGGGYSVQSAAKDNLINSVRSSGDGALDILPATAKPSFCSGATYLVFLQAISNMEKSGALVLPKELNRLLLVGRQTDGVGIWGRWNSNGPGTAKLFHDLGIGVNFTDPDKARRGDFLKIWWTDQIGAKEKGHSVIYLGTEKNESGEEAVRYWSSNSPGGYGERSAPIARIKHMLFSRLENIQRLKNIKSLPPKDPYLSSMLKVDEGYQSMLKTVGADGGAR
jgi:hypothetical protein